MIVTTVIATVIVIPDATFVMMYVLACEMHPNDFCSMVIWLVIAANAGGAGAGVEAEAPDVLVTGTILSTSIYIITCHSAAAEAGPQREIAGEAQAQEKIPEIPEIPEILKRTLEDPAQRKYRVVLTLVNIIISPAADDSNGGKRASRSRSRSPANNE